MLLTKAKQLLDINWKETYLVQLSASVAGNNGDGAYFYRSRDITTTGILRETNQTFHHGDRVVLLVRPPRYHPCPDDGRSRQDHQTAVRR